MGVSISYMGTKRGLAPAVCDVVSQAQKGAMLDAFAGMCSVGERVAPTRQIWSNDTQVFAAEIAKALFTARDEPLGVVHTADIHYDSFERHRHRLSRIHSDTLEAEESLLNSSNFETFRRRNLALSKTQAVEFAGSRHYQNLFTVTYSNNYFGIRQAIEADAIVAAVNRAQREREISDDHRRWLIIALGRTLLKVATSTGHFAQFLKPRKASYKRYISQGFAAYGRNGSSQPENFKPWVR